MKKLFLIILNISAFSFTDAQSLRSIISNGNDIYKNEKYSDAEVEYLKGIEKGKDEVYGYFNRGNTLLKQNKDSVAGKEYLTALTKTENKDFKSQINYNIGNVEMKNNNYEKAVEHYKQSLRLNPNDEDARYNLGYALKQIQIVKKDSSEKKNDKKENKENKKEKQDQKDQQQDQQKQNQSEQRKEQPQPKKSNITKENAERILQAINENEKDVQKKLKKRTAVRIDVEKDW